jgi:hypothetical protein
MRGVVAMKRPGQRRPEPEKKAGPPGFTYPAGFNEVWFLEWSEFGWADLAAYLQRHLAFDRFYDARPHPENEPNQLEESS